MEKFLGLSTEKQSGIIDAALKCFSMNGYKKTSVSDIATAAGISKAMVFHYFGNKKSLYLYLIDYCANLMINEINEKFDHTITDFFDRIKHATNIKVSVMKKHPAIFSFLYSMYFETDEEVKDDIQTYLWTDKGENFRNKIVFEGMDASKFKDGIDPGFVMKMIVWLSQGLFSTYPGKAELDIDALCRDFYKIIDLLKNNFYKEELL